MPKQLVGDWLRISIHALHEESDLHLSSAYYPIFDISIHALHEESDHAHHRHDFGNPFISIHALHEESDSFVNIWR